MSTHGQPHPRRKKVTLWAGRAGFNFSQFRVMQCGSPPSTHRFFGESRHTRSSHHRFLAPNRAKNGCDRSTPGSENFDLALHVSQATAHRSGLSRDNRNPPRQEPYQAKLAIFPRWRVRSIPECPAASIERNGGLRFEYPDGCFGIPLRLAAGGVSV
jgi:hypothetical protein